MASKLEDVSVLAQSTTSETEQGVSEEAYLIRIRVYRDSGYLANDYGVDGKVMYTTILFLHDVTR